MKSTRSDSADPAGFLPSSSPISVACCSLKISVLDRCIRLCSQHLRTTGQDDSSTEHPLSWVYVVYPLSVIGDRMAFSIRLTDEEEDIVRRYATSSGISVEEAFKRALFEKIEDEYDTAVGEAAYRKYLDDPSVHSHEEVLRMFDDER